jgi:hypothetical protein
MQRMILPLLALVMFAGQARAVVLTNLRVTTGPLGSNRNQTKFLPGDSLFLSMDIQGIQVDPKTGTAKYQTTMQIMDGQKKEVFNQKSPEKEILLTGGNQLPGVAFTFLPPDQAAGKYQMKITVRDVLAKDEKSLTLDFEVLPQDFGLVQPMGTAVAFGGQDYASGLRVGAPGRRGG